jgi:hypothetical protein
MMHVYASSREKRIDMWVGFAVWIALTIAVVLVATLLSQAGVSPWFAIYTTAGAAILLGLTRPYAAFGLLLAAATVAAVAVVEVPFFVAGLVVDAATGGAHADIPFGPFLATPGTAAALAVGFLVFLVVAWLSLRGIDRRLR